MQFLGGCEVSVVAVERAGVRGRLAWPGGPERAEPGKNILAVESGVRGPKSGLWCR